MSISSRERNAGFGVFGGCHQSIVFDACGSRRQETYNFFFCQFCVCFKFTEYLLHHHLCPQIFLSYFYTVAATQRYANTAARAFIFIHIHPRAEGLVFILDPCHSLFGTCRDRRTEAVARRAFSLVYIRSHRNPFI